jgi:hypothetical protein
MELLGGLGDLDRHGADQAVALEEAIHGALRDAERLLVGDQPGQLAAALVGIGVGIRQHRLHLLLAQLEMVAGKRDELSHAMKQEEASAALDELKKKMQGSH